MSQINSTAGDVLAAATPSSSSPPHCPIPHFSSNASFLPPPPSTHLDGCTLSNSILVACFPLALTAHTRISPLFIFTIAAARAATSQAGSCCLPTSRPRPSHCHQLPHRIRCKRAVRFNKRICHGSPYQTLLRSAQLQSQGEIENWSPE
jgi:hypothetical protein